VSLISYKQENKKRQGKRGDEGRGRGRERSETICLICFSDDNHVWGDEKEAVLSPEAEVIAWHRPGSLACVWIKKRHCQTSWWTSSHRQNRIKNWWCSCRH
jgi:hypothetical protein